MKEKKFEVSSFGLSPCDPSPLLPLAQFLGPGNRGRCEPHWTGPRAGVRRWQLNRDFGRYLIKLKTYCIGEPSSIPLFDQSRWRRLDSGHRPASSGRGGL